MSRLPTRNSQTDFFLLDGENSKKAPKAFEKNYFIGSCWWFTASLPLKTRGPRDGLRRAHSTGSKGPIVGMSTQLEQLIIIELVMLIVACTKTMSNDPRSSTFSLRWIQSRAQKWNIRKTLLKTNQTWLFSVPCPTLASKWDYHDCLSAEGNVLYWWHKNGRHKCRRGLDPSGPW